MGNGTLDRRISDEKSMSNGTLDGKSMGNGTLDSKSTGNGTLDGKSFFLNKIKNNKDKVSNNEAARSPIKNEFAT